MIPAADYHLHTSLCGHAAGDPAQYVAQAQKIGLSEVGFSDHAPLLTRADPTLAMNMEQLPQYHEMIDALQKTFAPFPIKRGIEVDYVPGMEKRLERLIESYAYDYVIGSVHHIDGWAFDHPAECDTWEENNVNDVYRAYYALLRSCAASGLFDIMGHVDLVKKFGHRATDDVRPDIEETARVFAQSHVSVEINSSGLRKPANEIYPSLEALSIYCREGVPVTFGSDAHDPSEVGQDFDKCAALARQAGYSHYVLFSGRKISRIEKL